MAVWNPRLLAYANIGGMLADDIDPDAEPLQVKLVAPLANNTDADGDVLTAVSVAEPAHGTAVIVPLLNMVIYTPDPSWHGTDAFTYTVTDSTETATAMV